MFRSGVGWSPARWLAALPAGSHVRLSKGAVFVKQVTRWMPAGMIAQPVTGRALVMENDGGWPTLLEVAP